MLKKAEWVEKVEEEEGIPLEQVIMRERKYNVPEHMIAASFEISPKTYDQHLRRMRAKGVDV